MKSFNQHNTVCFDALNLIVNIFTLSNVDEYIGETGIERPFDSTEMYEKETIE